jgi:hypothetical protein
VTPGDAFQVLTDPQAAGSRWKRGAGGKLGAGSRWMLGADLTLVKQQRASSAGLAVGFVIVLTKLTRVTVGPILRIGR